MASDKLDPPLAAEHPRVENRHGDLVNDPFFWLREKDSPAVREYLEAENAYTEWRTADLKPLTRQLYEEMLARIQQTDRSVPARDGDFVYYHRYEQGAQYPIYCRQVAGLETDPHATDQPEEVLLDLNQMVEGRPFISLGDLAVSDDGNFLAYTLDYSGFRQYQLYVKDLRANRVLPDTCLRVTSVCWAADNETIFMTTEDEVTKRSDRLVRHRLGVLDNEVAYFEADELYDVHLERTRDRRLLILTIGSKDTTEQRYIWASTPQAEPQVFLAREKGHRYYLDLWNETVFVRTNRSREKPGGAKDFRLIKTSFERRAPEYWEDFVPHQPGRLVEDIDLFDQFAVVLEKAEGLHRLNVHSFGTESWLSIPIQEEVYHLGRGENRDYRASAYRYTFESLTTPPSVYDFQIATGRSVLRKRYPVLGDFDPEHYKGVRLWATVRDGTRVPISAVYRRDLIPNEQTPMLLYGYGSYGIGIEPSFSSNRLSLLDRGIIFAIAHIRGGDELGEQWREDGMLMKKMNTFFDFVDCAQWLIEQKWTSSDRLAIEGGSAGGLLVGVALNLRPDLFRAAHLAVPFVDVLNTMFDASLPLTVGEYLEWGNPNHETAYRYMRGYSPYDNLRRDSYPAILVTASLNDSQVMYWEPAKYVAKLRRLKTDANPLLLKIKIEPAGHGGASGRYDRLRDIAFEYAWLIEQIGTGFEQ